MAPFEELGGFCGPDTTLSRVSTPPLPPRTVTVASISFEERVSRYRQQEQPRFTPVFSGWGDTTTQRQADEDSTPGTVSFAEGDGILDETASIVHDGEKDDDDEDDGFSSILRGRFRSIRKFLGPTNNGRLAQDSDGLPLAYRYYGRKFARPPSAGSVPIILFGPNADHWKVTGQQLQQQGFSVIACERVIEEGRIRELDQQEKVHLIVKLLDALRWQNALLVACDSESLGAIQVAMQLAPDRIAGLVLCGNLVESTVYATSRLERSPGLFGLDAFLQEYLPCPFTIVWDGDFSEAEAVSSMTSDGSIVPELEASQLQHRSLLLGGGTAPHRRRPEQLAWIIARFVELNLAKRKVSRKHPRDQPQNQETEETKLPFGLGGFFSQESMVVLGRIFATAIAYGTVIKVGLYQYESFRSGIFDFQTRLHDILYTPEKLASAAVAFLRWIPRAVGRLFSTKQKEGVDKERLRQNLEQQQEEEEGNGTNEKQKKEEAEATDLVQTDTSGEAEQLVVPNATSTDENEQMDRNEAGVDDPTDTQADEEKIDSFPMFFLDNVIV